MESTGMFFSYSQNLLTNPLPAHSLHIQSPFHPSHLRRHPYLSPSLPPSVPWFSQLLKSARLGGPKIWLSYGTAEVTADHCRALRERLKESGWKEGNRLVVVEAKGETHGWHTYPPFLSKEARTYWPRLVAFLDS